MSDISRDLIIRLASLAKLNLSEEELETCRQELADVVGFIDRLKEADVDGLPPTEQVSGLQNVTRPDQIDGALNLNTDALSANAEITDGQFKVPRVNI